MPVKKNILITSWYYYPELTPRAFRTYELVKEFCARGHRVTLYLPNKALFQDIDKEIKNLQIVFFGGVEENTGKSKRTVVNDTKKVSEKSDNRRVYNYLKKIIPQFLKNKIKDFREWKAAYFYPIQNPKVIKLLSSALKKESKAFDLIVSIGLPIEVHIGTAIGILKNNRLRKVSVKIADYGDPFSKTGIFFGYALVDFFIANVFTYISVPTEIAVSSYTLFKRLENIKVIPQGFNLAEYKVATYKLNAKPTFAYAGCFYLKIRNPEEFFNYLKTLKLDFQFVVYTIAESRDTKIIIDQHQKELGDKLIVVHNMKRKKLIYELSKMDFLINFENTSLNQMPSKLIDYAIAKRPISSINTKKFSREKFNHFLNKSYSKSERIDFNQFNINNVANKFLNLSTHEK